MLEAKIKTDKKFSDCYKCIKKMNLCSAATQAEAGEAKSRSGATRLDGDVLGRRRKRVQVPQLAQAVLDVVDVYLNFVLKNTDIFWHHAVLDVHHGFTK